MFKSAAGCHVHPPACPIGLEAAPRTAQASASTGQPGLRSPELPGEGGSQKWLRNEETDGRGRGEAVRRWPRGWVRAEGGRPSHGKREPLAEAPHPVTHTGSEHGVPGDRGWKNPLPLSGHS